MYFSCTEVKVFTFPQLLDVGYWMYRIVSRLWIKALAATHQNHPETTFEEDWLPAVNNFEQFSKHLSIRLLPNWGIVKTLPPEHLFFLVVPVKGVTLASPCTAAVPQLLSLSTSSCQQPSLSICHLPLPFIRPSYLPISDSCTEKHC